MGAHPMGAPGCPDFAFCTTSALITRIVLMQTCSRLSPTFARFDSGLLLSMVICVVKQR
jgi:hypothetical protein